MSSVPRMHLKVQFVFKSNKVMPRQPANAIRLYSTGPCAALGLVAQSCLTLCDPWTVAHQVFLSMGILQARILEWAAMPSSRGSSQPRDQTHLSCIGRRVLYPLRHLGSLSSPILNHIGPVWTSVPTSEADSHSNFPTQNPIKELP